LPAWADPKGAKSKDRASKPSNDQTVPYGNWAITNQRKPLCSNLTGFCLVTEL
jgi:hypothetical protein